MIKIEKYMDYLVDGIKAYVDSKINKANFDKTENGQIVAINSNSTYNVKVGKNIYTNVKTLGGTCELNEIVKVVSPQNQPSNMFISKSGGSGESYALPIASESTLGGIKVGNNLIINANGILSANDSHQLYSTEEQVIGAWVDGKPLYQKTLKGSCGNDRDYNTRITFEHSVVQIDGGVSPNINGNNEMIFVGYHSNSDDYVLAYYTSGLIMLQNTYQSSRPYYILTVKYTKSTD